VVYPDVTAEFPGVTLEDKMDNGAAVVEDDEPDFQDLAIIALDDAGIDLQEHLRAARTAVAEAVPETGRPAIIDAEEDKIIHKQTFDHPGAGF
jgi:hypothetical protein